MLFSSMSFIYVFLPILCLIYFISPAKFRNSILLSASILFYWLGEPTYLCILLISILINYRGALLINEYPRIKKLILFCILGLNLASLIYFKYFNFILTNLHSLFSLNVSLIEVIMPLGISFYTFQAMSYVIDVYRGEANVQKSLYKLALYICLFPQLIAGPIIKYHDIEHQIDGRTESFDKVRYGIIRFIIGLSKKVLIANTMGSVANNVFNQSLDLLPNYMTWLGAIAYSFQIYFDFSGYSDMAVGLGMIFGFKFMENFNYPYISKSITEFWHRWHISLSTWFKQYLYIPLGGNKKGVKRTYLNLFIVFFLTGLWHGASWNFIIWGIYNGFFVIIEKMTGLDKTCENKILNFFKHVYTIIIFVVGWVIFRSENLSFAGCYLQKMFSLHSIRTEFIPLSYYISFSQIVVLICAILLSAPLYKNYIETKTENKVFQLFKYVCLILLFLASTVAITSASYNPFIYFRF